MPTLSLDEQETHFNIVASDRSIVEIYSDDVVYQRKLEAVGATLVKIERDGLGKHYTLPASQLSLRKPSKPMSPERKAQLGARLAAMRASA